MTTTVIGESEEQDDTTDSGSSASSTELGKDEDEEAGAAAAVVIRCQSTETTTTTTQATISSILARSETRVYLLLYWSTSFVSVAFSEIFPLFCMSPVAGLDLDELHIGQIMSLCGLLFAVCQYVAQSAAYNRFGLLGAVKASALVGTPIMFLIPISMLLNRHAEPGQITMGTMFFLAVVLAMNRICVMVFYSNLSVAMNRSVPPDHRGTAQGVCVMGENMAKGLGPLFAGVLTSWAVSISGSWGSVLIFAAVGMIGVVCTICTFLYLNNSENKLQSVVTVPLIEEEEEAPPPPSNEEEGEEVELKKIEP